MKSIIVILFFSLLMCCLPINGSNILYLSLTPSPSHHIWDKTLAMGLKSRGHHVTFVTHSPEKSVENFTTIIFEGVYDKLHSEYNYEEFANYGYMQSITELFEWMLILIDWDIDTNGFKQLNDLADKKTKYDLIIMDTTCAQFLYPIFDKLGNPPIIGTSPFGIQAYHTYITGYEIHYSYIPMYMLPFTDKMSFWERAQNYFYTSIYLMYRQYIYMPKVWEKAEKYFGKNIKSFQEVEKQFSFLLANTDPILDYPESLPPSIIPVGGLHTKREKSLPKDLQKILDNAKHGVVLFSLGTNFLSKDLKEDQKQALINGLGKLKETVIWKYEEEISGLPKNMITMSWVPQNDILAHPNVKAFITHGGALSTQEAMLHGVPVISMPFFADQHVNTNKMVNKKLGLSLKYGHLTADIVYKTVNEVVTNQEYKTNIKILSKRYRDQKEDPLTRALWWIEYTIRQGGAQYLATAARDMPNYQLEMLDIWAAIFLTILAIYFVLKRVFHMVCCKAKSGSTNTTQKKKKN